MMDAERSVRAFLLKAARAGYTAKRLPSAVVQVFLPKAYPDEARRSIFVALGDVDENAQNIDYYAAWVADTRRADGGTFMLRRPGEADLLPFDRVFPAVRRDRTYRAVGSVSLGAPDAPGRKRDDW